MTTKTIYRQTKAGPRVDHYLVNNKRHTLMQVAKRIGLSITAARRRIEKIGLDGVLDPQRLAEANREAAQTFKSEHARQANSIKPMFHNPATRRTTDHLRSWSASKIKMTDESRRRERVRRRIDLVRDAQDLDAVTREVWQ